LCPYSSLLAPAFPPPSHSFRNKAGDAWPSVELSPQAQWDALPIEAKGQIIFFVGCLEIWDEMGGGNFNGVKPVLPHYTKGRKPGQYPSLQEFRNNIHFVLDLYDPFGAWKGRSDEAKAKGRLAEINNGRLAMLGIMGFVSEGSIQGSVPALKTQSSITTVTSGTRLRSMVSRFALFQLMDTLMIGSGAARRSTLVPRCCRLFQEKGYLRTTPRFGAVVGASRLSF
jgi:hypothetical protein